MGDRGGRGRSDSRARSGGRESRERSARKRSRSGGGGGGDRGGKPAQGKYKITLEDIPPDMSWTELKDMGRESGRSLTFSRTYRSGDIHYGMLEFSEQADADAAVKSLDGRRIEGWEHKIRATHGDKAGEGAFGDYKGHGKYGGGGGGKGDRRPRDDSRGRPPPRRRDSRSRSPPRRRSRSRSRRRSPPRRGGGGGGGEDIMTLFVKDLPEDAREDEVEKDLGRSGKVLRVMLLRKNDNCNAFVRFETRKDAERALEDIRDGERICGKRVQADMARRNTETR